MSPHAKYKRGKRMRATCFRRPFALASLFQISLRVYWLVLNFNVANVESFLHVVAKGERRGFKE